MMGTQHVYDVSAAIKVPGPIHTAPSGEASQKVNFTFYFSFLFSNYSVTKCNIALVLFLPNHVKLNTASIISTSNRHVLMIHFVFLEEKVKGAARRCQSQEVQRIQVLSGSAVSLLVLRITSRVSSRLASRVRLRFHDTSRHM